MSSEVGSGIVAIFPTFKGFRKAVLSETDASAAAASTGFTKTMGGAGVTSGTAAGKGFRTAFTSTTAGASAALVKHLEADIATTSRALSAARLKEQDQTGKLRIATTQLTEAQATNVAGSSKIVAAEERVASANRALEGTQATITASTDKLAAAQKILADVTAASSARQLTGIRAVAAESLASVGKFGAGLGKSIGGSFIGGFKQLVSPLSAIIVGYLGFSLIERGFRAVTDTVKTSIGVMSEWQVTQAQTVAFVKSTGGAAGVTADQVHQLALKTEELTGTNAQQIQQGANIVGTFSNIRNAAGLNNNIYDRTVLAATNMARALGKDVPSAATTLGKALNDPATGLTRLTRIGVTFTAQQTAQIKALEKSGQILKAQGLIIDAVNKKYGESGAQFRETLPAALSVLDDDLEQTEVKLTTGLSPAFVGIINLVDTVVNKLRNSSFIDGLIAKLDTFAGHAVTKLTDVISLVETLSGSSQGITFAGITGGLEKIFPQLKPILSLATILAPILATVVKTVGPQLASAVQQILPGLGKLLVAILPIIPPLTKLAVAAIPVLISAINVLAPVLGWLIDNFLTPVFGAIQDIIDLLSGKSSFGNFEAQVQDVGGVLGFLQGIVESVLGFLFGVSHNIAQFVLDAIHNFGLLETGVIDAFVNIRNTLVGVGDQIIAALDGAGDWLVGVGHNIIQGLLTGVTDAAKGIGAFFGNIGKQALNGIKAALGIHSPSLVFKQEVGMQIGAGIIAGVEATTSAVNTAVAALVAVPSVATTGSSASTSAAATTAGGNVFIDKVVAPDQNPVVSGRIMGREFARLIAG